jgi:phosphatidyl-myo-inositol dimannoside synthase
MRQVTSPDRAGLPDRGKAPDTTRAKSPVLFPCMEPIRLASRRPILCVVVDAEEEFHWDRPVSARNNATGSIHHQKRAHDIFSCYGVKPTYLVTYPIASDPSASAILREYLADGRCDIGAQLHPWVTPPFDGETDERLSFPGNLPAGKEREKIRRLSGAIRDGFGLQPTAYKAGRYGLGPATAALLEDEGFLVDTSMIPRTSYADMGGPDFSNFDYGPFWFGVRRRLLERPVTRALTGLLSRRMPSLYAMTERRVIRFARAGGLLARGRLLERITLSPEGSDLPAMCRLCRTLLGRGERIVTLSYHSPSLEPGNTPYVRDQRDLAMFLDRLSGFLSFFQEVLGGEILTLRALHDRLLTELAPTLASTGASASAPPVSFVPASHPAASLAAGAVATAGMIPAALAQRVRGTRRCLVVANTFPPVHGGSAIVYDSVARFGGGRVSVLAPRQDYRNGWPIPGWREFDHRAPFRVHRIRLLRTRFLPDDAGILRRVGGLTTDLAIRVSTLLAIWRILRSEDIAVLCIGELVAGGWLAGACRRLFGVMTLIYVHGEEISTRTDYDQGGARRRRALEAADGIVAVSRFTRDRLIGTFGVPPSKIKLISNGVDMARFHPTTRPSGLAGRYGLRGQPVLLTVGRLSARKGMDRVIESLSRVRQQIADIRYLIVGEGPYRPTLEALVAHHGLGPQVIFAGSVPDDELVGHYALGDVFIVADREMPDGETEGFGLVFLEANACGLPVIAGKAGGSVDAVTDQVNGLVIDGQDTAAIAQAVITLFQDHALRRRLRSGGIDVARAAGWDLRVGRFLRFCDGLTTRRVGRFG